MSGICSAWRGVAEAVLQGERLAVGDPNKLADPQVDENRGCCLP